ncbi:MAG: sigma-70 family RNA polymerase sigma factor [Bacteroidetes bacterium]|nr:sigma-70 family RNA polymerase sigma factor [Bacteroidota bacterium]
MVQDSEILNGLKAGNGFRTRYEKVFYQQYYYFVDEGCRKYNLNYDDSFSAYSDALLSAIINIVNERFDGRSSLKTYLYQVFSNKCIDLLRKNTTNKQQVHKTMPVADTMNQLPDFTRNIVEKLMTSELKENVQRHLETLGAKCKEILLLFEDGWSDKDIAEQLSYNSAAVAKTTRLRCLDKLRGKITGTK